MVHPVFHPGLPMFLVAKISPANIAELQRAPTRIIVIVGRKYVYMYVDILIRIWVDHSYKLRMAVNKHIE